MKGRLLKLVDLVGVGKGEFVRCIALETVDLWSAALPPVPSVINHCLVVTAL
jgi:hypothetical protein